MSTGTNKERIEQNNELLNQIKTTIDNLPSAGSTSGVKLFKTEEEMQADTTAEEEDLAVIYRNEIKPISNGDVITSITFPKTVVFTEAITSSYYGRLRNSSKPRIYLDIQLDASRFMLFDMNRTIPEIEYSSTDGITYTRTDSNEDTYEIGETTVKNLDEHICKFMQVGGYVFEGFYKCEYTNNTTKVKCIDVANSTTTLAYTDDYIVLPEITLTDNMKYYAIVITSTQNNEAIDYIVYKSDGKINLQTNKEGTLKFVSGNKLLNGVAYTIIEETYVNKTLQSSVTHTVDENVIPNVWSAYESYGYLKILTNELFYSNTDFMTVNNDSGTTLPLTDSHASGYAKTIAYAYEQMLRYFPAPTQLTTINSNELLGNKVVFAYNGVITGDGSIVTPDNSFTDVPAQLYNKIQNAYNNMNPRILTDEDKTIDTGILFIPVNNEGEALLDTSNMTNMSKLFDGCRNLATIPLLNTDNATNMNNLFSGCTNLETIPSLNTTKVTNMSYMFSNCNNLKEIPLLSTGNVTTAEGMFLGCRNLATIPLLNTSDVTSMKGMFQSCANLTTVPQLDTNNVTSMKGMFYGCGSLTTIPLLDTAKVTDMGAMFYGCGSLTTIPLLDTAKVTDMGAMFYGCGSLTTIPLLDTAKVTDMGAMFYNCGSLTTIPQLDTSNVTNMTNMFQGCRNLSDEGLNIMLAMCTNATKMTTHKSLDYIGLTSDQANKCKTLSNYSAFTAAGWTTGY